MDPNLLRDQILPPDLIFAGFLDEKTTSMVLGQWLLQAHDWRCIKFVSITLKQEGHVTYGDNNRGKAP